MYSSCRSALWQCKIGWWWSACGVLYLHMCVHSVVWTYVCLHVYLVADVGMCALLCAYSYTSWMHAVMCACGWELPTCTVEHTQRSRFFCLLRFHAFFLKYFAASRWWVVAEKSTLLGGCCHVYIHTYTEIYKVGRMRPPCCSHTCVHTYLHTYMHSCKQTNIHTHTETCIQTYKNTHTCDTNKHLNTHA